MKMNRCRTDGSSWKWVKQGVASLHSRPSLWALPVLDCAARLVIWALAWYAVVYGWRIQGLTSPWIFILIPAWLLACFVKAYFSIALAHGLLVKDEQERLLNDGIVQAATMKWKALKWGMLDSVAGVVLNINATRGLFGQIIAGLGGMSWKMATLITPTLLAKGKGPFQAIEQSSEIVMSRLGQTALSTAGLWGVFHLIQGALGFLGFLGIWAMIMTGHPVGGIAVGLGAGLLILATRAYEGAVMIAFATEIFTQTQEI